MSSPLKIITGGCAVWPLPHTAACASFACTKVRETLAFLLPASASSLDDWLVVVSELATNAWVYGLGGRTLDGHDEVPIAGGSELAIYRRGSQQHSEIVITVFDPGRDLGAIPDPTPNVLDAMPDKPLNQSLPPQILDRLLKELPDQPLEEYPEGTANLTPQHWSGKRGLRVVRRRCDGRFGFRRSRSRLGEQSVSGKVAWFAVPIPDGTRAAPPPRMTSNPVVAAQTLKNQLSARGLDHLICNYLGDYSVLSLAGATVWCHNQHFTWQCGKQTARYPFYDMAEVVEQIISLYEDHEYVK